MKIRLEVDLTPAELRQSFGLPDVAGLQEDVIQYVRDKIEAGVDIGEAISMVKSLVPEGVQAPARVQKMFGKAFSKLARSGDDKTTFKVNISDEDGEFELEEVEAEAEKKKPAARKPAAKKKAKDDE